MGKRLTFPTRAFGSDGIRPDRSSLAEWISQRRGREGDLISFLTEQELSSQQTAGVDIPCAGGSYSFGRWKDYLTGIDRGCISGELEYDGRSLTADAEEITTLARDAWLTIPAPHLLNLEVKRSRDRDETISALYDVYQDMMRSGRDAHLAGHVLFCDRILEEELESFTGKRTFFFCAGLDRGSLVLLLEYQHSIALNPGMLPVLEEIMEDHIISRLILLDPAHEDLHRALSIRNPDQIMVGGYCPVDGEGYWKKLVESSFVVTGTQPDRQTS